MLFGGVCGMNVLWVLLYCNLLMIGVWCFFDCFGLVDIWMCVELYLYIGL